MMTLRRTWIRGRDVALLAAALLLVSAFLSGWKLRSEGTINRLRHQVQDEAGAAETLLATLTDAETGQRGFLLTGDPSFLEPYMAARARIDADLARLEESLKADPERADHLARLKTLVGAKLAELGLTIKLRQAGQSEAALARVRGGVGKRLMDAVRAQVATLHRLGDARLARARAEAAPPWIWPIGTAGLASLLLGGLAQSWLVGQREMAVRRAESERYKRGFGLTQSLLREFDGRITLWGPGLEAMYGYTAEMAVGRISHDLLATRFPVPLAQIEADLQANGDWNGELVHRCRDGTSKTVMSHWVFRPEAALGERIVVEMNFDITDLRQSETYLRLALEASGLGTWCWEPCGDGPMQSDSQVLALYGLPPGITPNYEMWRGFVVPEDLPMAEAGFARLIDPADALDQDTLEFRINHPSGQVRWLAACRRAEFVEDKAAPSGRALLRLIGTLCDITTAKELVLERERNAALLLNILETAPGPIYAKDREGRFLVANAAALALIGKPWAEVEGRTDLDVLDDPAQAERLMATDRKVMESGIGQASEESVGGCNGQSRVWLSAKTPMRADDGRIIGLVGVSVEITERKRAETRRELMIHELNHRVKNTLATVQAVASETLQGAAPAMRAALNGRLLALASVHDILTRESWHSAELGEVVAAALAPFGGGETRRFRVGGPHVLLMPRAAVVLAMGLHELATNATKYGALHVLPGWVSLTWDIHPHPPPQITMTWAEHDGPPVVVPSRRGFGSNMIEGALACDLDGNVTIYFDTEGVRCVIQASLDNVAAPADEFVLPSVGNFLASHRSNPTGPASGQNKENQT